MFLMGAKGYGIHRAVLHTFGATDAIICDLVPDHVHALSGGTNTTDVGLIFIPEIPQRGKDRIGCPLSQSAEAAFFSPACQAFQFLQVFLLPPSGSDFFLSFLLHRE